MGVGGKRVAWAVILRSGCMAEAKRNFREVEEMWGREGCYSWAVLHEKAMWLR